MADADMAYSVWGALVANLSFLGLIVRWLHTKDTKQQEKLDEHETKLLTMSDKFLTEPQHKLLCENATLKIERAFKEHFDDMKDAVFEEIRSIKKDESRNTVHRG